MEGPPDFGTHPPILVLEGPLAIWENPRFLDNFKPNSTAQNGLGNWWKLIAKTEQSHVFRPPRNTTKYLKQQLAVLSQKSWTLTYATSSKLAVLSQKPWTLTYPNSTETLQNLSRGSNYEGFSRKRRISEEGVSTRLLSKFQTFSLVRVAYPAHFVPMVEDTTCQ